VLGLASHSSSDILFCLMGVYGWDLTVWVWRRYKMSIIDCPVDYSENMKPTRKAARTKVPTVTEVAS
jgi:hypothetical protein